MGYLAFGGVVGAWRGVVGGNVEAAVGHGQAHELGDGHPHVDAEVLGVEELGGEFGDCGAVEGDAKVADDARTDQVGIADGERLDVEVEVGGGDGEDVVGVEVGGLIELGEEVAAEQEVLVAALVIAV